jgi:hypothetical protein
MDLSGLIAEERSELNSQIAELRGSKVYSLSIECRDEQNNSYKENLSLMATSPFNMTINAPADTYDRKPEINVTTSRTAVCSYTIDTNQKFTFEDPVYGTKNHLIRHNQTLSPDTSHRITVDCKDIAGTTRSESKTFRILLDSTPPKIVRAYSDGNVLTVITDEKALCAFSTRNCTFAFEDGTGMPDGRTIADTKHEAAWEPETITAYYIKCMDEWDNLPSGCTITIKPQ